MVLYVPGTEETDPKKQNMSLQQIAGAATTLQASVAANTANIATNTANIATNTTDIATNTTNIATNTASINAMQSAWTAYTPTVTASSGTFTTVSATGRQKTNGKTVFVQFAVTITTVGTASGIVAVSLPATAKNTAYNLAGNAGAGFQITASIVASSSQCNVTKYDGTTAISAGATLFATGVYEAA